MPQIGIIPFENASIASAKANAKFASLANAYVDNTNYEGTSAPSLPDYFALTSGRYSISLASFGGNPKGKDLGPAIPAAQNIPNIFRQLIAAGHSWKTYEENMNTASWDDGTYAMRHAPAAFFTDTRGSAGAAHASGRYDFTELAYDVAHSSFPDYFWITPNKVDDGHDNGLGPANTWLASGGAWGGVDAIIAAMRPDGLLFITFDNVPTADTTAPITGSGKVYAVIAGQGVAHKVDSTYYNHFSFLKGCQAFFSVGQFTDSGADSNYTSAPAMNLGTPNVNDTTAPTAPTSQSAVAQSATSIKVTFAGATDNVGVVNYEIWRALGAGSYSKVATASSSPFTDTGLAAATLYNYKVKAVDAAGNASGFSGVASATTSSASSTFTVSTTPLSYTPGHEDSTYDATTNKNGGRMWYADELAGVTYEFGESDWVYDNHTATETKITTVPYVNAYKSATGEVIQTYALGINGKVTGGWIMPSGDILFWGAFTSVRGSTRRGLALVSSLSGPTDTANATLRSALPDLAFTGGQVNDVQVNAAGTAMWVGGTFTSCNGSAVNGVVRLKLVTGTWQVDTAFTCPNLTPSGNGVMSLSVRPSGSWMVVTGQIQGAVRKLNQDTGVEATGVNAWAAENTWTVDNNTKAITSTCDDNFVFLGGDRGPNSGFLVDWNGTGPNNLTQGSDEGGNPVTYHAYWFVAPDGNVQASAIVTLDGTNQWLAYGHHGNWTMAQKSVTLNGTTHTASDGAGSVRWGNVTNDTVTFLEPPVFGAVSGESGVLKVWGIKQLASGDIVYLGDFGKVGSDTKRKRSARFPSTGATSDTTKPSTPGTPTATATGASTIHLAWGASTDNVAVAGYRIFREGVLVASVTPDQTSYDDSALLANTTYHYTVSAIDSSGNVSALSAEAAVTTQSGGGGSSDSLVDTYNRTVANGLGTSDNGYVYTVDQAPTSQFSVTPGHAQITNVAGNAPIVAIKDIDQQDYDETWEFDTSGNPVGAKHSVGFFIRYVDALNYTRAIIEQVVGGNAILTLQRQINNVNTTIGTTFNLGAGLTVATKYKLRLQGNGTTVQAKLWLSSASEPTSWSAGGVDGAATPVSGGIGIRTQAVAGYTGSAVWRFYGATGAPLGGGGGLPPGTVPIHDDSGHGMAGTLIAGASGIQLLGTPGHAGGRALLFDGTGGRIEIPDPNGALNAVHWSIGGYIFIPTAPGDSDPVSQRYELMEKAGAYWLNVRYDTVTKYLVRTGSFFGPSATFAFLDSAAPISLNAWHHIVGTYDGVNMKVYIDGVLSSTKAQTGDSQPSTEPLVIGAKHRYLNGELLEAFMPAGGKIEMPFVVGRAITLAEVQAIRAATFPIWTDLGSNYTPSAGQIGRILRPREGAHNRAGDASAIGAISSPIADAPSGTAPGNLALPQLDNSSYQEGSTAGFLQGQWNGSPAPTLADTIQIAPSASGPWTAAAAPGQSYVIPANGSKVGSYLSVSETGTNASGSKTVRSFVVGPITAQGGTSKPIALTPPRLTPAQVQAGVELTAIPGTWSGDTISPTYTFWGRTAPGQAPVVLQAASSDLTYVPDGTYPEIQVEEDRGNTNGTTASRSDWAFPAQGFIIAPLFPVPGQTVTHRSILTLWSIDGQIPTDELFYVRLNGGPWITATLESAGILSAPITLSDGDGSYLLEGDVH